jgi:hypothetical protein
MTWFESIHRSHFNQGPSKTSDNLSLYDNHVNTCTRSCTLTSQINVLGQERSRCSCTFSCLVVFRYLTWYSRTKSVHVQVTLPNKKNGTVAKPCSSFTSTCCLPAKLLLCLNLGSNDTVLEILLTQEGAHRKLVPCCIPKTLPSVCEVHYFRYYILCPF